MTGPAGGSSKHVDGCECVRCRGFEPGHTLSLKDGTSSERMIAPIRDQLDLEFARTYADLSPARRSILADRAARLVMARRFLDEKGDIFADRDAGEPWPVLARVEKWEAVVDRTLAELEVQRREANRPVGIVLELQQVAKRGDV